MAKEKEKEIILWSKDIASLAQPRKSLPGLQCLHSAYAWTPPSTEDNLLLGRGLE